MSDTLAVSTLLLLPGQSARVAAAAAAAASSYQPLRLLLMEEDFWGPVNKSPSGLHELRARLAPIHAAFEGKRAQTTTTPSLEGTVFFNLHYWLLVIGREDVQPRAQTENTFGSEASFSSAK